jgi:hypothetical protein
MGIHDIKKLLHKEMISKLKKPQDWEKILLAIHQRTDNQNIEGAQKTKLPKNQ